MFVLDTNTPVYFFRGEGQVAQRLLAASPADIAIPTVEEAKSAATLRARLEQVGTPIGPMDTLIAGTAVADRGVLVTRNVREFRRVPGLAVEDWYA